MRWDNLTLDGAEQHRLPGYRDPASVRRFDAPEALDMRFYEVHAKSVLNRVPEQSRMPFRWTVNPYRGCTHACAYCVSGDTRVLMADGTTKPISRVSVGDMIYGTRREGKYRRFVRTPVLAQWATRKAAYRVTLEDGTAIVASGDHRFLTSRGWKHVIGEEGGGPLQRPHLTLNSKLIGVGEFALEPFHSADYRTGYLCGMIRGDGTIGSYAYRRPGGTTSEIHNFRLALADRDGLARTETYLSRLGVQVRRRLFAPGTETRPPVTAIYTGRQQLVDAIREAIEWPRTPSEDWRKGFLAGIFDAEGSCGPLGVLRISNTDSSILRVASESMSSFGFSVATETTAHLKVVEIEPLGKRMELFDITTGTGDFIANGVVSHNCFARPTHKYLGFDAGRDFEREIVVKVNAPEVLRTELARKSWKREHVALGTNTDPYQWVESRYRLMVGIWEALRDAANPCSVLTKSPLLLRDIELMKQIAAVASFSACLSIPTLDEKAWRETEPHTPNPRARLEAVAELNRAGIPTGVLIAPLMPGINDSRRQLEPLFEAAREAGASSIGGVALHLRGEVRQVFMGWLREKRPALVERYAKLYGRGAYAPPEERRRLAALVRRAGRPSDFRFTDAREQDDDDVGHAQRPAPMLQTSLF